MELYNAIMDIIKSMDDSDIIRLWNSYCYEADNYDDVIMDAYDLEAYAKNQDDPLNIVNRFFYGADEWNYNTSANPNRDYFVFDGYANIISFDYIYSSYTDTFRHGDFESVVNYMIENENAFGVDEIQELFDDMEV